MDRAEREDGGVSFDALLRRDRWNKVEAEKLYKGEGKVPDVGGSGGIEGGASREDQRDNWTSTFSCYVSGSWLLT